MFLQKNTILAGIPRGITRLIKPPTAAVLPKKDTLKLFENKKKQMFKHLKRRIWGCEMTVLQILQNELRVFGMAGNYKKLHTGGKKNKKICFDDVLIMIVRSV